MELIVRPSTIDDVRVLANGLRPWDAAELGVFAQDTLAALEAQVTETTECLTVCLDGRPIGLGGIKVERPGLATVGFLGTPEMERVRFWFFREARKRVAGWMKQYGTLCNGVAADNHQCKDWLARLGARFVGEPFVVGGMKFQTFQFGGEPCAS